MKSFKLYSLLPLKKRLAVLRKIVGWATFCLGPCFLAFDGQFNPACADPVSYGYFANTVAKSIPEMANYTLVFSKESLSEAGDGNTGLLTWYDYADYNNFVFSQGYRRAAFYLELQNNTTKNTEWIVVTTPNYQTNGTYTVADLLHLGIPNAGKDANGTINTYATQTVVSDMNVYYVKPTESDKTMPILSSIAQTSDKGYKFAMDQTGIIEMWPSDYGGGSSGKLTIDGKAVQQTGRFDWYDSGFSTSNGHGSFQIHLYNTAETGTDNSKYGQTLFALNNYRGDAALGIGTNDKSVGTGTDNNEDWTFQTTKGVYSVRTLQIFAQSAIDMTDMCWTSASGSWTDASQWFNIANNPLNATPQSTSKVNILSGEASLNVGETGVCGSLELFGGVLTVNGALTVNGPILSKSESAVNLGGTLTAVQGGTLPSIINITSGTASIVNSSADTVLSMESLTGGAGSALTLTGGPLSISGPTVSTATLNLSNTVPVTLTSDGSVAISSALTGAGAVNQTTYLTELSGNNTGYTGAYTVSAGGLKAFSPNNLPTNLSVESGAALMVQIGDGGFTQDQYNALASDTRLKSGSALGVIVSSDQTLGFALPAGVDFAKSGGGTLTITGTDTAEFAGKTYVYEGELQIGNGSAAGKLGGQIDVLSQGSVAFNLAAEPGATKVMSNLVSGDGTLVVRGGTLEFTTASPKNAHGSRINSNVAIESGARVLFNDKIGAHSENNSVMDIQSGGVLEYNVTSYANNIYHYADSSLWNSGDGTLTITGSGTFVKSGPGTLCMAYNAGAPSVFMAMGAGGWIDVQGGTFLKGGWGSQINWTNNQSSLNLASGTLFHFWDGNSPYFDSLTGGGSFLTNGGGTLILGVGNNANSAAYGVTNNTAVFNGCVGFLEGSDTYATSGAKGMNNISVTKKGTGTQILAGNNNYSGSTSVEAGTLQIGNGGDTGTIGTGNVSVGSGANLIFNTSKDNTISGILSGAGTVTQRGAGSTLALTNKANTISGPINVESGRLQVGGGIDAPSFGSTKINMSAGTELEFVVPAGSSFAPPTTRITGSDYTLVKSGAGTMNIQTALPVSTIALDGGTTNFLSETAFSSSAISVTSDSTAIIPTNAVAQPWTVTQYRWLDSKQSKYSAISPALVGTSGYVVGTNIQEYTGESGWNDWNTTNPYSAAAKNAVPTVWDMSGAGNVQNGQTNTTRNYLSEYATLSYQTTIQVSKDLTLDFGGSFDDTCAAYARKLDANGDPTGDWITLTSPKWTSQTDKVALSAGTYLLDVCVGDVAGGAYATGSVKAPDGTHLGMGVRVNGAELSGTTYYPLNIDATNGVVGLPDGSIRSVTSFAAPVNLENNNLTIAEGVTLTLDNANPDATAVNILATIHGTGTLALADTSGAAAAIPYSFTGSSEGSIQLGDNMNLTIGADTTIAGNLTIGENSSIAYAGKVNVEGDLLTGNRTIINLDQDAGNILEVEGAWEANGSTYNIKFSDPDEAAIITADTTDFANAAFNIEYTGPEALDSDWTFIVSNDAAPTWNDATFNFTFPTGDYRAFAQFADGKYQIHLGNSESIPEPSTWVLLILGAAGLVVLRKRKP